MKDENSKRFRFQPNTWILLARTKPNQTKPNQIKTKTKTKTKTKSNLNHRHMKDGDSQRFRFVPNTWVLPDDDTVKDVSFKKGPVIVKPDEGSKACAVHTYAHAVCLDFVRCRECALDVVEAEPRAPASPSESGGSPLRRTPRSFCIAPMPLRTPSAPFPHASRSRECSRPRVARRAPSSASDAHAPRIGRFWGRPAWLNTIQGVRFLNKAATGGHAECRASLPVDGFRRSRPGSVSPA